MVKIGESLDKCIIVTYYYSMTHCQVPATVGKALLNMNPCL